MWVRAGSISGYEYEVDLYTGKKPNVEEELGENVVLNLIKQFCQSNCCVTIDNFFMSVNVAHTLHNNGSDVLAQFDPTKSIYQKISKVTNC